MSEKSWYALYTKPRWEKKVHELLVRKEITTYCPLNRVRKKWSDRYKIVEEPLFKSYLFVQTSPEEMTRVRMTDGVLNFVYWNGKPAVVSDKEIDLIKRFLKDHENVTVESLEIAPETPVKITSGVFMDLEGKVIRDDKNRVMVEITSLGYRLVASVGKGDVEKIAGSG